MTRGRGKSKNSVMISGRIDAENGIRLVAENAGMPVSERAQRTRARRGGYRGSSAHATGGVVGMGEAGVRRAEVSAHLRQAIEDRDVPLSQIIEQPAHLGRNLAMSAERLGQWIDELAVLFDREVQMRP